MFSTLSMSPITRRIIAYFVIILDYFPFCDHVKAMVYKYDITHEGLGRGSLNCLS